MSASRICALEGCDRSLEGHRANARYCCGAHRTSACRARKRPQEVQNGPARTTTLPQRSVTVRTTLVTLSGLPAGLLPPLCPNPSHCKHFLRHPTGPWTCDYNHPRIDPRSEAR